MNAWLVAATVIAVATVPALVLTLHGSPERRLVGLQAANVLTPLALVAAGVGSGRSAYLDVALVVALLSFAGGVAYARSLERWL